MAIYWNSSRELVFALFFLYFSDVIGSITSPPQNIATKVGSQTFLNCSANNGVPGWRFGEQGKDFPIVGLGSCSVSLNYTSKYRSEAQGGSTCNLIFLNPSLQESGVYTCQDFDTLPKYTVLTVLNASGTPTVNNGSEVVEGDQLTMTCTVQYGTAPESSVSVPIPPILLWTTSGINITNPVTVKTNVSVASSITVDATRDGIPSYDCTAHFLPPANKPDLSSNAPSNVYIGGTYPITSVQYGPTIPNITRRIVNVPPNGAVVCSFNELTCNSSANPSPSYTWRDVSTGNVVATGNVLSLAEDNRTYRCTASNKVNSSSATYTTGVSQPRQCIPAKTDNILIYSDDSNCDSATNTCSCVNGSHVNLICNDTNAYPLPSITWVDENGNVLSNSSSFNATSSGNYTCRASNQINLMTNTTAAKNARVTDCCPEWKLIVSVIIPWIGECLIASVIFIVCYATLATPFRAKMLSKFPWLDFMLPCIKKPTVESRRAPENGEKPPAPNWMIFVFVALLILVSVTCGIVFFPILITIAYFSPKSKVGEATEGQYENSGATKPKPAYLIPLIVLMWFGVVVFMFPLTFVLVYFIHCEQMTFRYVVSQ